MTYIIVTIISLIVGGVAASGGGSSGGGNDDTSAPTTSSHGSYDLTVDSSDATVANGEANLYKTGEYNNQWGLDKIQAAEAYQYLENQGKSIAGDNVIIGISDNGVELEHREIFNNDYGSGHYNDNYNTSDGHGTHVASTAAGVKDGAFMHGVAFNSKIISANVIDNSISGSLAGISALAESGVKVINMSWSFSDPGPISTSDSDYSTYLSYMTSEFTSAVDNDIFMTVAAGNDSDAANMSVPAIYAQDSDTNGQMIAVASFGSGDTLSIFSNNCTQAPDNCLVAPGETIYAAIPSSPYYENKQGTSMATPHVAGAAAVLRAAWPSLSATQVADILLSNADTTFSGYNSTLHGKGLLDLYAAVQADGISNLSSSSSSNGSGYDVESSQMTTSSLFGNAYSNNIMPILQKAVFFDSYGRDYKANLDQKINQTYSNGSYNIDNIMFNNYQSAILPLNFSKNKSSNLSIRFLSKNIIDDPFSGEKKLTKMGLKYLTVNHSKEDQNSFNNSNVSFAYNTKLSKNLNFSFHKNDFYNSFSQDNPLSNQFSLISYNLSAGDPYQKLTHNNFRSDGYNQISKNQFSLTQNLSPQLKASLSYANYNISDSTMSFSNNESRIFNSGINYQLNKSTNLGFKYGSLGEFNNNFLGSKSYGAFEAGSNPETSYFEMNLNQNLFDKWHLTTSYSQGKTQAEGNNLGIFRSFDNIKSRGVTIGLLNSNIFNGKFGIIYSEPLRIYSGSANINIPISQDENGNVQRLITDASLVPNGKEKNLELSYSFKLKNNANINFNSIIQREAGNIKNIPDQYYWMVRYSSKF